MTTCVEFILNLLDWYNNTDKIDQKSYAAAYEATVATYKDRVTKNFFVDNFAIRIMTTCVEFILNLLDWYNNTTEIPVIRTTCKIIHTYIPFMGKDKKVIDLDKDKIDQKSYAAAYEATVATYKDRVTKSYLKSKNNPQALLQQRISRFF
jgi:hypothetical protein